MVSGKDLGRVGGVYGEWEGFMVNGRSLGRVDSTILVNEVTAFEKKLKIVGREFSNIYLS